MKTLLKLWLLVLAVYLFAMASVMFAIPPAPALLNLYLYVMDNRWETRGVVERVKSDLDIVPYRVLTRDAGGAPKAKGFMQIELPGKAARRENPHVFLAPERKAKLTFLHGVFDFQGALHGAILLDETGQVSHRWLLPELVDYPGKKREGSLYPHGVLVDPDGSVTYIFDFGGTINKVDACGRKIWSRADGHDYNHVLSRADDGSIWTIDGQIRAFVRIDPDTGDVIDEIPMEKIVRANLDLGIFTTRFDHFETGPKALADPYHANDIEPLPAAMAAAFPMFRAGDLLISLRALNLIFVMDPDTARVKWYSQGETQLQHDPDFMPNGRIEVLDNHWFKPPSRILSLDPAGGPSRVVLDGASQDFFTPNRGKIEGSDGGHLVTSSKQGRVFELDPGGRKLFEFVNTYDDKEGLRALVSEAMVLPMDYFTDLPDCD